MIFLTYIFKNFSKSWFFINYGDYRCSFFQLSSAKYNIFNIADNNIYSVLYFQKVFYFDFFNNIPLDLAIKKLPTHLILWNYYRGLLIPYWSRVVFKGKGYRMRKFKKKKKITFNFGHSHWTKLSWKTPYLQFIRKKRQNQLFFCFSYVLYTQLGLQLQELRRINRYTKRGLRLKKQQIRRRFGKISQMISAHNY